MNAYNLCIVIHFDVALHGVERLGIWRGTAIDPAIYALIQWLALCPFVVTHSVPSNDGKSVGILNEIGNALLYVRDLVDHLLSAPLRPRILPLFAAQRPIKGRLVGIAFMAFFDGMYVQTRPCIDCPVRRWLGVPTTDIVDAEHMNLCRRCNEHRVQ